jgi:hypothetical protein
MVHYGLARTFAVNPARQRRAPCGLWGLTALCGQASSLSCQECTQSSLRAKRPGLVTIKQSSCCTGDMGDNLWAERIVEWLQSSLLQVDIAEIIVHEADEPDAVIDLLDAERVPCKDD